MIVKAITPSVGIGGLTNYLFDGKEEGRKADKKKAEVLLQSDNIRVPRDGFDLDGRAYLKSDFHAQEELNQSKDKANVGMHIISFTNEDLRDLKKQDIINITKDYIELTGLTNTQYYAVAHNDTANYHIHLVFNKVDNNGKKLDSWQEKNKAIEKGVAISLNYNLTLKGNNFKIGQQNVVADLRKNHPSIKALKENDQTGIIKEAKNYKHLKAIGDNKGVKVISYSDQQDNLKANNQKFSQLSKKDQIRFNHTMVGDKIYRNQDLNAVYKGNQDVVKNERAQRKGQYDKDKAEKQEAYNYIKQLITKENIPQNKQNNEISIKMFNLGFSSEKEKFAKIKPIKIPSHKIKIAKLAKSKGIER